jgi:hypothetical protein
MEKLKFEWKIEDIQDMNSMTEEQREQLEKEIIEELMKPENRDIINNFNLNPGSPFQPL